MRQHIKSKCVSFEVLAINERGAWPSHQVPPNTDLPCDAATPLPSWLLIYCHSSPTAVEPPAALSLLP
jgi:hypothetical protein